MRKRLVVKAQGMDSETAKALRVQERTLTWGERSDFRVERGRGWTKRCRPDVELQAGV